MPSAGLPKTILVGLARDWRSRRASTASSGPWPTSATNGHPGRTIINLAPADLPKDAGGFDLPIALGMLVATGQLLPEQVASCAIVGELALDGSVRPIKGALSMAMAAAERGITQAARAGRQRPRGRGRRGRSTSIGVGSLAEAVGILTGQLTAEPVAAEHRRAVRQAERLRRRFRRRPRPGIRQAGAGRRAQRADTTC